MRKKESPDRNAFLKASTRREVAGSLGIEYKILTYNLYILPSEQRYIEFKINKRNGKKRNITAPDSGIKHIQAKLSRILLDLYPQKNCVHGYSRDKGIKTNAIQHTSKRILINLDLKDFFPSINFGRVRGLFQSHPFNFNDTVATVLAQICCHNSVLPQGAPTSPVISNFICRRLDNHLLNLAKKGKFTYTRYADDITFSTNLKNLPKEVGEIINDELRLSNELLDIISSNGFQVNPQKVRYAFPNNRQEVTGLIVNKFPNVNRKFVRHIRSMLHAWEKYGIYEAAREHFEKYNYKNKTPVGRELAYQKELIGKIGYIGMVRGKSDSIYKKLRERIKILNPKILQSIVEQRSEESEIPVIFGEGLTDWKHLKVALESFQSRGAFSDLKVQFETYDNGLKMNNTDLLKICEGVSKTRFHKTRIICLFDRDVKNINKKVCENGKLYKHWGSNVFSVLLPKPEHREFEEICIEHFYQDSDLMIKDNKGRRLFLSTEFNKDMGNHLHEELICVNHNWLKSRFPRIIDDLVFNSSGKKVALTKNAFADKVLNKEGEFANVSFDAFESIFRLLLNVISLP